MLLIWLQLASLVGGSIFNPSSLLEAVPFVYSLFPNPSPAKQRVSKEGNVGRKEICVDYLAAL